VTLYPGFILDDSAEPMPTGRIEPDWEPASIGPAARAAGSLGWIAGGLAVLLGAWFVLSIAGFVADQFNRSDALGGATIALFAAGAAILGRGVVIETRAYSRLRTVDRLRGVLARADASPGEARTLSLAWIRHVTPLMADPGATRAAVSAAATTMEVTALLRTYVVAPLQEGARQAGRRAALEGGAIVAVTPSPALDGVFAALRGLMLIRQVASLYGLRPGVAVTLTLVRRVIWTAASISGVELLSRSLADHTLQTMPLVRHLAGAVPGTSITALRLYRLAAITAEACSPLSVEAGGRG